METCAHKSRLLDRESLLAFTIYFGLSLFFFGRGLIGHFGDRYIGVGPDPSAHLYFLAWWPYAVRHRLNPFITRYVWFPSGVNLTHSTSIVLPALLFAPLTLLFGPTPAYTLIMLLSPAFSALAAFILYKRISSCSLPAFTGGFIYGFSPFELGHMLGQPSLVASWFAPLIVYFASRRLDGGISSKTLFWILTLLLIGQAGFSLETLATTTLIGGLALIVWSAFADVHLRYKILTLLYPLAGAYAVMVAVFSPYFYYFFHGPQLSLPSQLAAYLSVDPLNFLIPTETNELGFFLRNWLAPHANLYEATAHVGLPAILIVAMTVWRQWRSPVVRLCAWILAITAVLAIGPFLEVSRRLIVPAPELLLFLWAPFFKNAMPCRFTEFIFFCR